LEIRRAAPSEFAAVGDLCVAAYAAFLVGDDHYVATLRDAQRRSAEAELLVAADSEVLGTVTFVPDGGPFGEIAGPDETEFRLLAVSPSAQGRGVGTALVQHVIDASAGRERIVCSSLREMRTAHRIYERFGFTRAPERDWSPVPGVDLIAFALNL
jgi:ribosomal protein S18 acetylase RimI-like enzyme